MKILVLMVTALLVACATTTLTEQETAMCEGNQPCLVAALADKVQDEQYAAEDKRILREEKIISYILGCHYAGHVMFYKRRSGGLMAAELIDRHGYVNVPKHAYLQDFACVDSAEARRVLEQMGIGSNRRMSDDDFGY